MMQSSDRISTRTRRCSATVGTPSVDYGFGPGRAPRPSSRRVTTQPRVLRSLPAPPAAATPALADSPFRKVLIVSDHAHADPLGTPVLRLTSCPGETPIARKRLDALSDAAELGFADSDARYPHADWKGEQDVEPTCHAAMRYITVGRPSVCRPTFWPYKRPSLSDIQELAGKGRSHTIKDDVVLLVNNPTPRRQGLANPSLWDELLACKMTSRFASASPFSCALGSLSFDGLLLFLHHEHVVHAGAVILVGWHEWVNPMGASPLLEMPRRKTAMLTVRWPIISMPLPKGPGVAVCVAYFGPLLVKTRHNTYICCSPVASVVGPTCSPSQTLNSPRRMKPIPW